MRRFLTILALTVCLSASAWSSTDPQFGNVSPSLYTGGTLKPHGTLVSKTISESEVIRIEWLGPQY